MTANTGGKGRGTVGLTGAGCGFLPGAAAAAVGLTIGTPVDGFPDGGSPPDDGAPPDGGPPATEKPAVVLPNGGVITIFGTACTGVNV
ncbi:hypothetical protein R1sor_024246 [Riccia sorocarpa]|uniref:Uncharacterized protein n=1 Tax=Riccia sorocarpa TaxID=122646 RepID=A0ABD3GT68_9MARC